MSILLIFRILRFPIETNLGKVGIELLVHLSLFSDKIFPTVDYGKSPFVTDVGPFFRIIESMTKMRFGQII